MNINVCFNTKNKLLTEEAYEQDISCLEVNGKIARRENSLVVQLEGLKDDVIKVLRLIWELSFLYEGYFYVPEDYYIDGVKEKIEDLYFLSYYKSGKIWRNAGILLSEAKMNYSEEVILAYDELRNTGRESKKLCKSLINSFFYLHSQDYEKINVNHRLSLLLNTCDGVGINFEGKNKNVQANIANIIKNNLNVDMIKSGAELLGIPKSKLFDALKCERDEIDHYVYKAGSLSDYLTSRTDKKADYVNWYFVYVLELAIRISFLKQIGIECPDERKLYALNEINDWIILECDLDVDCKNPKNMLKQQLQRKGITMR